MGRSNRKVSEGSRVEAGTHRSESREIGISSAVGISGLQAGEDVKVPAQADGRDAPQPNPYAPPRADVADVSQRSSATARKSLLPIWLAASYCIIIGACHVVMLVQALYRAGDMLDWLLPQWAYAFTFIQPAARLAAGISLIRRSRLSPVFFVALTAFTAIFPILWQRYWNSQTGYAFRPGPLSFLVVADLLVLVAITRYAFALKSRGMLSARQ